VRIVVYDLETKNKPTNPQQWKDWPWMGISVGAAYDYLTGEYSVYMDDNLPKLIELLNSADLVAAFNHISFDNNLLAGVAKANGWPDLAIKKNYDMLVESRAGAKVDMYAKGFKLDAHLKATLRIQKTGDGGDAPALHQVGKIGELASYCLADVHRERLLFEHMWDKAWVACEHGKHSVKPPRSALGITGAQLSDVASLVVVGDTPMHMGVDLAKPVPMPVADLPFGPPPVAMPVVSPPAGPPPAPMPVVTVQTTNPEDL
jgi:hypothetical protein